VVFTLPHQLAPLAYQNKRLLYRLLFRASAATLLEVAAAPRHLSAEIGFLSVLHTWGQNLQHHPHVHCVIPAGGLSTDHTRWIQPRYPFFLPVKVLSRVFRGKFVAGLQRAYRQGKLGFYGDQKSLQDPKLFRALVRSLFRQDWIVYAKPPFGGPQYVLHYLARYTHRVAISNHRLVSFQNGQVSFRWKDYAHGSKQRIMTLSADEFLRRFLLHVLPKGFVRIRFFGFLANRRRATLLPICRQLLAVQSTVGSPCPASPPPLPTWSCPVCGGPMMIIERLTAKQMFLQAVDQGGSLDTSGVPSSREYPSCSGAHPRSVHEHRKSCRAAPPTSACGGCRPP